MRGSSQLAPQFTILPPPVAGFKIVFPPHLCLSVGGDAIGSPEHRFSSSHSNLGADNCYLLFMERNFCRKSLGKICRHERVFFIVSKSFLVLIRLVMSLFIISSRSDSMVGVGVGVGFYVYFQFALIYFELGRMQSWLSQNNTVYIASSKPVDFPKRMFET